MELGFELRASTLTEQARVYNMSHPSSPFCSGYFGDGGVSQTIYLDWPQTIILLISAS
jgi:hypothetical protein